MLAEDALRLRHARDAAVEAIEHHGAEDAVGRLLEAAVHRHDDGVETAEQGPQREQVGQDVDALAARARWRPRGLDGKLAVWRHRSWPPGGSGLNCATGPPAGSS